MVSVKIQVVVIVHQIIILTVLLVHVNHVLNLENLLLITKILKTVISVWLMGKTRPENTHGHPKYVIINKKHRQMPVFFIMKAIKNYMSPQGRKMHTNNFHRPCWHSTCAEYKIPRPNFR